MHDNEIQKWLTAAKDAQTGHFPAYIYGGEDHVYVLARELERALETIGSIDKLRDDLTDLQEQIADRDAIIADAKETIKEVLEALN